MFKRNFAPTIAQISAACRRIRSGWTEDERRRRAGLSAREWNPPQVVLDPGLAETVREWEAEAARRPRRG